MFKLVSLISLVSATASAAPAPQAVVMEFISIGTGINHETYSESLAIIGQALAEGQVGHFHVRGWGREGERTLCVQGNFEEASQKLAQSLGALNSRYINFRIAPSCEGQ